MHHQILLTASLLTTTVSNSKHFSFGPWIIVPILVLAAVIAIPIYIVRDRRKRQDYESESSRTSRR
jgi:hypothetical protein